MASPHDLPYDLANAPFMVTDPGTGVAIQVDRWNQIVPFTVAGTETNTLGHPINANQRVKLVCSVRSSGTRTVTVAAAFNAAANTTLAFDAAGEWAILESHPVGSDFRWKLISYDGATPG